jgi:predicted transcriptional regulator
VTEYISRLSGLELAKYVLLRLTNDRDNVEKIAEDFENDRLFISGVVDFLKEIGWVKQNKKGTYNITKKGKENIITHQKQLVKSRYMR